MTKDDINKNCWQVPTEAYGFVPNVRNPYALCRSPTELPLCVGPLLVKAGASLSGRGCGGKCTRTHVILARGESEKGQVTSSQDGFFFKSTNIFVLVPSSAVHSCGVLLRRK